jgi:hypothetical protein
MPVPAGTLLLVLDAEDSAACVQPEPTGGNMERFE